MQSALRRFDDGRDAYSDAVTRGQAAEGTTILLSALDGHGRMPFIFDQEVEEADANNMDLDEDDDGPRFISVEDCERLSRAPSLSHRLSMFGSERRRLDVHAELYDPDTWLEPEPYVENYIDYLQAIGKLFRCLGEHNSLSITYRLP